MMVPFPDSEKTMAMAPQEQGCFRKDITKLWGSWQGYIVWAFLAISE